MITNDNIISEIKSKKIAATIAQDLGLHDFDLYKKINELESMGYSFDRKYFSDGTFQYTFKDLQKLSDEIVIRTNDSEREIQVLCISDLHTTSSNENKDLLKRAYDYAYNRGIRLIFLGGDIINGTYNRIDNHFDDGMTQVDEFLKVYPFSNDVLTFGTGGDHDFSILTHQSIDPLKAITSKRHDIVIPGYGITNLRIYNASIALIHKIQGLVEDATIRNVKKDKIITIEGHHHQPGFSTITGNTNIWLPSIAKNDNLISGFSILTLSYGKKYALYKIKLENFTMIDNQIVFIGVSQNLVETKEELANLFYKKDAHVITKNNNPLIVETNYEEVVDRLRDANKTKTEKIDNLTTENESLKESLKEKKENIKTISEENNTIKELNNNLTRTVKSQVKSIKNLTVEVTEAINENAELKNNISDMEEENATLSSKLEKQTNDNKALKTYVSKVKDTNTRKDNRISMLESENNKLKTSRDKLNENNEELKQTNKKLLEELNEYKSLLKEYQVSHLIKESEKDINEKLNDIAEHREIVKKTCEHLADNLMKHKETITKPSNHEEDIHKLYEAISKIDDIKDVCFYNKFKKERIKEYSKYLHGLEKEEPKLVEETNEKEFFYKEFKKERIEEFKKYLKKQNKEEHKKEMHIIATGTGKTILNEAVKMVEALPVSQEKLEDEIYTERMCDVLNTASLSLSGEKEKKRVLKVTKSIQKDEKLINSQLPRQARVEELKRQVANKKR